MRRAVLISLLAFPLASCGTAATSALGVQVPPANVSLERALAGESQMSGRALEKALEKAAAYPLGSRRNPVRAEQPSGQHAYLARLRCADGAPPRFSRDGADGFSPYQNIVDVYTVTCRDSTPASSKIYLDMYHKGYVETRPVEGFTIVEG